MRKKVLWVAVFFAAFLSFNLSAQAAEGISEGKTVKFNYVLIVEGEVVDSSEGKTPLEYTQGQNMIIPGLEQSLVGLKVGDKKTVIVAPEDAYGIIDERGIIEVPKERLGEAIDAQVGMVLQMTNPEGEAFPGKVVEVKEDVVVLDFNHPLAGKELKFDVEIVEVN